MSVSVNEWDNEYARLARIASQRRSQGTTAAAGAAVVGDVQQLSLHLQRLDQNLNSLPVSPPEIQRRRRLIQHLQQGTTSANGSPSVSVNNVNTGYYVSPSSSAGQQQQGGGEQSQSSLSQQQQQASEQTTTTIDAT